MSDETGSMESHLRHLLEEGFEVAVVGDATASARVAAGDGYLAALTNFNFIANALWPTEEAVRQIAGDSAAGADDTGDGELVGASAQGTDAS